MGPFIGAWTSGVTEIRREVEGWGEAGKDQDPLGDLERSPLLICAGEHGFQREGWRQGAWAKTGHGLSHELEGIFSMYFTPSLLHQAQVCTWLYLGTHPPDQDDF